MHAFLSVAVSYDAATLKALRGVALKRGVAQMIPGDLLRGKNRIAYLEDRGYVVHADGEGFDIPADVALTDVRHLATLAPRKRKGEIASDQECCGASDARCPALADAGIAIEAIMGARRRNTHESRGVSLPCPCCVLPCLIRDGKGEAPEAGAYDATQHAIRDAAGRLKVHS